MPNRRLTPEELVEANALLNRIRVRLESLACNDATLLFAFRRKIYKELSYDERTKPAPRKKLKAFRRGQQGDRCAECDGPLPARGAVLDRLKAQDGYTEDNTRLLSPDCDGRIQAERGFS